MSQIYTKYTAAPTNTVENFKYSYAVRRLLKYSYS